MLASKRIVHLLGVRRSSSWHLMAASVVERPAVLVRPMNPFEKVYANMLLDIETENSLLSDFELQEIEEKKAKDSSKGPAPLKVRLAEDTLKDWKAELDAFSKTYLNKPSTEAKPTDPKRHLDQALSFLVKQKIGNESHWNFPQIAHKEGETLRQTAERALQHCVGDGVEVRGMGNAPCAFYKYKFPKDVRESTGKEGAKVFFFKLQYRSGVPTLNKAMASEFIWATHDEMAEKLPKVVYKAVKPAFFRGAPGRLQTFPGERFKERGTQEVQAH